MNRRFFIYCSLACRPGLGGCPIAFSLSLPPAAASGFGERCGLGSVEECVQESEVLYHMYVAQQSAEASFQSEDEGLLVPLQLVDRINF